MRAAVASPSASTSATKGVVDDAALAQHAQEALDRIARAPLGGLVVAAISGGVVGGGVRLEAVGDRLDQRRSVTATRSVDRRLAPRRTRR